MGQMRCPDSWTTTSRPSYMPQHTVGLHAVQETWNGSLMEPSTVLMQPVMLVGSAAAEVSQTHMTASAHHRAPLTTPRCSGSQSTTVVTACARHLLLTPLLHGSEYLGSKPIREPAHAFGSSNHQRCFSPCTGFSQNSAWMCLQGFNKKSLLNSLKCQPQLLS
jgi:hypothetical protein